jgi:hypothetical protein
MRKAQSDVPSDLELKRLFKLAYSTSILCSIIELQDSLAVAGEEASDIETKLEDIKDVLNKDDLQISPETRRRVALILKRLIAFNNKCQAEISRFDEVGLGGCIDDAGLQLKAIDKASRLLIAPHQN